MPDILTSMGLAPPFIPIEQESKKITKMEKFTLFPNLPFELRSKVWRSTLRPRNVGIKIRFKDAGFGGWMARESSPPPPMALQICRESREEALRHYILSFGTARHPPTIYFNYHIDSLYFGDGIEILGHCSERIVLVNGGDYLLNLWLGKSFDPRGMKPKAICPKNVRYMTLDVDDYIYSRQTFCWEEIRLFEGLKELLLVAWDADDEAEADARMAYFRKAMNAVAEQHPEWVLPKTEVVSSFGTKWGSLQPGQDVPM